MFIDEILNNYWDREDVQKAKEDLGVTNTTDGFIEFIVKVQEDNFRMGLTFAKEGMEYACRL
jgi:hypothetical protein